MAERAFMGPRGVRLWAVGLAAFLSWAALSEPAFSQAASGGPSAAELSDSLFAEGKALRKAGRKMEAREKYVGALALKKSYDVAGNLGSLELELEMFRDAAEHLAFAVRTYASSGSTAEQVARARKLLADAKKHVTAVKVAVNVRGAEVFLDGKSVGFAPLEDDLFVEPGTRVFEAKLAGHVTARETLEAVKGGERGVALALSPIAAGARPEGKGPERAEGASASSTRVPPVSSQPPLVPRRTNPEEAPGLRPVVIIGAATAGALLVAGVVFVVAANGQANEADELRPVIAAKGSSACLATPRAAECEEIESVLATQNTFGNLAILSFVTAGALGAGTVIYAISTSASKTPRSVHVTPVVTGEQRGLAITGRW